MNNFNTNTTNNDEWLTPPEMIRALGEFDLDPCFLPPNRRPWVTAKEMYYKEIDGLSQTWFGRVWCNPPYGKNTFAWMDRLAEHGNGIGLIFARTDTKGFHESIFNKADAILFLKGRVRFYSPDGERGNMPNAASCLVAYGKDNVKSLENSGLKGKLVLL